MSMNDGTIEPTATLAVHPSELRHARMDWLASSMNSPLSESSPAASEESMITIVVVSSMEMTMVVSESL